jgi:hypothetical protein
MGEVSFVRRAAQGRDLVYAYSPEGCVAWAVDLATGEQWWYDRGDTPLLRRAIEAEWLNLSRLPVADTVHPLPDAGAPPAHPIAGDLLTHRPGHAVLAKIAELHAAAAPVPGLPLSMLPDEIVTWSVGFVGEEAVGIELSRLGPNWSVLHGVPLGDRGADIDHVVVGPSGVVCINTKHHRNLRVDVRGEAIFVGGRYQRYAVASGYEAERAEAIVRGVLPTAPVRSLLVVVGGQLRVHEQPAKTTVLPSKDLARWIEALPVRLSPDEVAKLRQHLRQSATWATTPPAPAAPEWAAELARSLAMERAVVADQRRNPLRGSAPGTRARRGGAPPTRARGRTASPPAPALRSGASRIGRLAIVLAAAVAVALVVPSLLRVALGGIKTTLVPAPKPVTPSVSVPTVAAGSDCAVAGAGAQAQDSRGRALECSRLSASKPAKLVWKRAT